MKNISHKSLVVAGCRAQMIKIYEKGAQTQGHLNTDDRIVCNGIIQ